MWILGYDLNLIWFILLFFSIWMVIFSGIIFYLEDYVPSLILELFRYGKTLNGPAQNTLVSLISLNKGHFTHFYIFSGIYVPFILYIASCRYIYGDPVPPSVLSFLDFTCGQERPSSRSSPASILLVLTLLTIQVWRRLYECIFVNKPTKATINLTHYIVGYAHYFCTATGYLCEAPDFSPSRLPSTTPSLMTLLPLVLVFCLAWYTQFSAHKTFAHLKTVNPVKHSVPSGGLFELVSCPHYLAEVLLYTVFMLILGTSHSTGVLVWAWVTINQVIAATMSHHWYKTHFKDYPKERKAIFPYLL